MRTLLENARIIITGGAGLVGQNLLVKLTARGCRDVHVIDKSDHNLAKAEQLHQDVAYTQADLSMPGSWQGVLAEADIVVLLHAQIGGNVASEFERNNITATENVLAALPSDTRVVHVSSSVTESAADDNYSKSKTRQETLVAESGFDHVILRPTLMFGWFDRKHLGWLSRFMQKVPVFPIPGDGRYLRQPLYAGDFCDIIMRCMQGAGSGERFNISGKEKVDYVEIIRMIKRVNESRTPLLHLPYRLFYFLLALWGVFDRNPPFTTAQLEALVIDEVFEDVDWEGIFEVSATPLEEALRETFTHPVYSGVELKF